MKTDLFGTIYVGTVEYKFINFDKYYVVTRDGFLDFRTTNLRQLRLYKNVLENQRRKYA